MHSHGKTLVSHLCTCAVVGPLRQSIIFQQPGQITERGDRYNRCTSYCQSCPSLKHQVKKNSTNLWKPAPISCISCHVCSENVKPESTSLMQQMVLNGCSQSLVGLTFTASQVGSMGWISLHISVELSHHFKRLGYGCPKAAPGLGNSATIRGTSRCGLEAKPRPAFNAIWAQICVENWCMICP